MEIICYFSPPAGNLRGELCIWDVAHRQLRHRWVAHKRTAITCVKFTHDSAAVYSCGEDGKVRKSFSRLRARSLHLWGCGTAAAVMLHRPSSLLMVKPLWPLTLAYPCIPCPTMQVILWDWRKQVQVQALTAHQSPVTSVDMCLDGTIMASGGCSAQ